MSDTPVQDQRFTEIESHRAYLVRYAMAQLRDEQLAQEAVQECLLAALEGIAGFRGQSALRTWLTSILRFKIADLQRRAIAERAREDAGEQAATEDEDWIDQQFDETGHWRNPPQAWSNPEAALEQSRFWQVFEKCLARLPAAAGRVFFKREVLGEETEEICGAEGITANNCWVMLHRSRIALRECLQVHWFGEGAVDGR
jgi:RNA polymerase sigma-70 factor (ECF subfamily)